MPEEDKRDPPRAAQGSQHLPWDRVSIPTKAVCLPGAGGWDGGLVFAKVAGGGFRQGVTTSATVESLNACRNCGVGRRPSGSTNIVRALKDASSTPRRSGGAANARPLRPRSRRKGNVRQLPLRLRVVTQHTNIPRFFALGRDVTKRCVNLRRPRLVLWRRLSCGRESRARPRAQVVVAQSPRGPLQASSGIPGRTWATWRGRPLSPRLRGDVSCGAAWALVVCGRTFSVFRRCAAKLRRFSKGGPS